MSLHNVVTGDMLLIAHALFGALGRPLLRAMIAFVRELQV